jgi:hypothetical protein
VMCEVRVDGDENAVDDVKLHCVVQHRPLDHSVQPRSQLPSSHPSYPCHPGPKNIMLNI